MAKKSTAAIHRAKLIMNVPSVGCILALLLVLCPSQSFAQVSVALAPPPKVQFFYANGIPLAGGKVFTYTTGTSTPLATYTDNTGTVANANPITLDAGGFVSMWMQTGLTYRILVQDANGVQQYIVDGVQGNNNAGVSLLITSNHWTMTQFFDGGINASFGGVLSGTFTGNPAFTGTPAFNGVPAFSVANPTVIANLNASLLNGATFAAPGPIGSTTPSTGAFTTLTASGQISSTLAIGTAPFSVVSTTLVPNLNVGNINGVAYPATAPAHSVPVVTAANTTVTYKVVPNCAGSLSYNQSTDAFGCSSTAIQTASVTGCTALIAALCTNTVTWPVAFADASYKAVCSGVHISVGTPYIQSVLNYTTTTIDVNTFADSNTGSAQFGTINCIGVHP